MRLQLLPMFGLAALALGCEGGQTGDLSGRNENEDRGGENTAGDGCEEHRQELSGLSEVTAYGSAEQVLAFAERAFDAPLTWKEPRQGASWSASPETGASSIHLEVTRGEKAYLLTYEPAKNDTGQLSNALCPPAQLGVEAHVTVSSEGGALSESFDALLRAQGPHLATLSVALDLTKVAGELSVSYSNPNAKLVQLGLDATFMVEGTTGSLSAIEEVEDGEVVSAGPALLAVWPDAPACAAGESSQDSSGVAVAADANALGITGDAAAELIAGMTPVTVKWLDGSSTELTVTTTLMGDGCLRATNGELFLMSRSGSVTYPALFEVASADGRVQGQYSGTLVTAPADGAHDVKAQAHLELLPEQVGETGFSDAVVPSGVETLMVAFEARHAQSLKTGSLFLNGMSQPPCPMAEPQPQEPGMGSSSPGCAGSMRTVIESTSW